MIGLVNLFGLVWLAKAITNHPQEGVLAKDGCGSWWFIANLA